MKNEELRRSPLFYVGDKYKLITEIKTFFPKQIKRFVEPFVGGGSVFLNVEAESYLLNDLDKNIIDIHQFLCSQNKDETHFFEDIFEVITHYGLSCSYKKDVVPLSLKQQYKKTYYAHFNKEGFTKLKNDYNASDRSNILWLYVLLIYGFNRMLRFNSKGDYNLPVGNVDFNKNVYRALVNYFSITKKREIYWKSLDFRRFFEQEKFSKNDFIYFDPPYLITFSEYNKYWTTQEERDLLLILDDLSTKGISFAISNVTHYKNKENKNFIEWAKKYQLNPIKSNYISYHDNSIKDFNEVLVTNY